MVRKEDRFAVNEIFTLNLDQASVLYDHFPLAAARNQIRLLQLKAGVRDDPVTCFLEIADLESCPEYEMSVISKL